jgi:CRISPR-associated exonuclease Cas4
MQYLAIVLLILSLIFLWVSRNQQKQSGLPHGRIIYSDPAIWGKVEKPFFDVETQLTGKPDYLVTQDNVFIPVEVKSSYAPLEPYASHIFQLLAYCLLVERETGQRPPYGIIKYRNRTFAIDYTREQELALLDLLDEMRMTERQGEADRSHQEPGRCARCGFRTVCDQKL